MLDLRFDVVSGVLVLPLVLLVVVLVLVLESVCPLPPLWGYPSPRGKRGTPHFGGAAEVEVEVLEPAELVLLFPLLESLCMF